MIHIICSVCKDIIGEFPDLAKAGEYSQDRTKSKSFSELQDHGFVNVCSDCENIYSGLDLKEAIRKSICACKGGNAKESKPDYQAGRLVTL